MFKGFISFKWCRASPSRCRTGACCVAASGPGAGTLISAHGRLFFNLFLFPRNHLTVEYCRKHITTFICIYSKLYTCVRYISFENRLINILAVLNTTVIKSSTIAISLYRESSRSPLVSHIIERVKSTTITVSVYRESKVRHHHRLIL